MKPVIAIDGPLGSGKGTMACRIADYFGFSYLDTGTLYRMFACMDMYLSSSYGADENFKYLEDSGFLSAISDIFRVNDNNNEDENFSISSYLSECDFLNSSMISCAKDFVETIDRIPEQILRSEIVGMKASELAKSPKVRETITKIIREYAFSVCDDYKGSVFDGRDIGTVVFPEASCKIFLTASPEVRAARRFREAKKMNKNVKYEEIYENLMARDEQDSSRGIAPLSFDKNYVIVNSSDETIEETFANLVDIIKKKVGCDGLFK
jgi:cytidylate kinase